MGWSSETFVARARKENAEALWAFVQEAFLRAALASAETPGPGAGAGAGTEAAEAVFCCHFLQGRCRFGAGCRHTHIRGSASEIRRRGCSNGEACFFGHGTLPAAAAAAATAPPVAAAAAAAGTEEEPESPAWSTEESLGQFLFLTASTCLEQRGPKDSFDDPLWLQVQEAWADVQRVPGEALAELFVPYGGVRDGDPQDVAWFICRDPAALQAVLQGPQGRQRRDAQREGANALLRRLHSDAAWSQPVHARSLAPLLDAACFACARVQTQLPDDQAPWAIWEVLEAALADTDKAAENLWRGASAARSASAAALCGEFDDVEGSESETEEAGGPGSAADIRYQSLWQLVQEARLEVSLLAARVRPSSASASGAGGCGGSGGSAGAGAAGSQVAAAPSAAPSTFSAAQPATGPSASGSVEAVVAWLLTEGFGEHAPRFKEEAVDCEAIRLLTEEHLAALGVSRLGDRLKLLSRLASRPPPPARARPAEMPPGGARAAHGAAGGAWLRPATAAGAVRGASATREDGSRERTPRRGGGSRASGASRRAAAAAGGDGAPPSGAPPGGAPEGPPRTLLDLARTAAALGEVLVGRHWIPGGTG